VALNPKLGDGWAHYYAFELRQAVGAVGAGPDDAPAGAAEEVLKRCAIARALFRCLTNPHFPCHPTSLTHTTDPPPLHRPTTTARCVAAEPNRGELWCAVAKATEYRRADTATVMKRVVERMYQADADAPAAAAAPAPAQQ
jgi:hypothetical protein